MEEASVTGSGGVGDLHLFPWRICLAGGWLDQKWVSEIFPGSVIVINVQPHELFKTKSGLATSTRLVGLRMWGCREGGKPPRNVPPEELAKFLFGAENPPGCKHISGSQDALGLLLPGVSMLNYDGEYWPESIETMAPTHHAWLESVLSMVPLPSRAEGYNPLITKNLTVDSISKLADASIEAWIAIEQHDARALGRCLTRTLESWREMLPETIPMPETKEWGRPYDDISHGYLLTHGGGFLIVVSDPGVDVPNGFRISINNDFFWR